MANFTFFQVFSDDVLSGKHNFTSDDIRFILTNTAPNLATNAVYSDVSGAELATGAGYTHGGASLTSQSLVNTSGTTAFHATAPTWTATGALGPFRYVLAYNNTSSTKPLVGSFDRGSSLTLSSGDTYSATIDGTTGLFTLG